MEQSTGIMADKIIAGKIIDYLKKTKEQDDMMVNKIIDYLNQNKEAYEFVKNFNEENGFLWSENSLLYTILDNTDIEHNTTPPLFALYLRNCQYILNMQKITY